MRAKSRFIGVLLLIITAFITWAIASSRSIPPVAQTSATPAVAVATPSGGSVINLNRIPIGDGKLSQQPQVGSVWSCRSRFRTKGGAFASGDWMNGDGTYDLTAKPTVDGTVNWPSQLTITLQNETRRIAGNRLPQSPTGRFPIAKTDDAYQFDDNPNSITAQDYQMDLPAVPQEADQASCLQLGAIGVLVNGGYFFNALDARGEDAVAHEIQDQCQGHPERNGAYHYHSVTTCMESRMEPDGQAGGNEAIHSKLLGYAWDGFGIYGHRGEQGQELTNANLDACHGHTHEIEWDGKKISLYHYHATWEYPYTVGCYKGVPVAFERR
jgi:hypothetical protein